MREPTPPLRQPTAPAARASRTAVWLRDWSRELGLAIVVGLFLAFSGAFAAAEGPLQYRLLYWLTLMPLCVIVGGAISRTVRARGWLEDRPRVQAAAVSVLVAVPVALVVWLFTAFFFGRAPRVQDLLQFAVPVLLVSAVMTALGYLTARRPAETHAAPAGAPPPRFLERLPFKLKGAELYAVEAEDHYLRLHTSRGSDLILMRLGDAVAELEGIEGARTHRSWWVAKDAVASASRAEGRATLTLKDGTAVPVSRTFVKALREEGWF